MQFSRCCGGGYGFEGPNRNKQTTGKIVKDIFFWSCQIGGSNKRGCCIKIVVFFFSMLKSVRIRVIKLLPFRGKKNAPKQTCTAEMPYLGCEVSRYWNVLIGLQTQDHAINHGPRRVFQNYQKSRLYTIVVDSIPFFEP